MGRQILTFFLVFAGLALLLRGCGSDPQAPEAVATFALEPEGDPQGRVELRDDAHDVTVTFDVDGTIIAARDRDGSILDRVNGARRPFHLNEALDGGRTAAIPKARWRTEAIEGGYAFVFAREGYEIRREVRLAEDGGGLVCRLVAKGVPDRVRGFQLTALSGVDLGATSDDPEPYLLLRRASDARATVRSWTTIVQDQEAKRFRAQGQLKEKEEDVSVRYEHRVPLGPSESLTRLGLLGGKRLLLFERLPRVAAVNTIAYRLRRDQGTTREIETWLDLPAGADGYEGEFRVRWTSRARAGEVAPPLAEVGRERTENTVRLENDTLRVEFTDRGAAIGSMALKRFVRVAGDGRTEENWVPMIRSEVPAGQRALTLLLPDSDRFGVNPADATWEVAEQTATSVTFRLAIEGGWTFEKRIAIPAEEDRYDLSVTLRATKPDGAADERFSYVLVGPAGSYIADTHRGVAFTSGAQGFRLEREGGDDDTIDHPAVESSEVLERDYGTETNHLLKGLGVRGAFFSCVLRAPARNEANASSVVRAEIRALPMSRPVSYLDGESYATGLQGRVSAHNAFGPSRTVQADYRLYCGPNDLERLRPLDLEGAVDFSTFASIGRFLMWLMKSLNGLFGSLGLSIMFMTLIVRAVLLPVSYKSQLSVQRYSKRMQKLKPVLEELEKKYGKNRQKLNQERMRTMKEHKVGFPLGCLMMFVQIPIWIALFGALRVEFALRHEPFLWAADLSMPDRLFGLPFWPHWFNLLPILMLVLWVIQQKVTPQAQSDDPQVAAQMKMVRFMPYVFFFMLYTYAAALSVYMCVSSAWGIAEGKLVRRAIDKHGD